MNRRELSQRALSGLIVLVCAVLGALSGGGSGLREAAFDGMLRSTAAPESQSVMVVAIDAAALAAIGPWPWPRDRIADLIHRLGADEPRAIVLDMLLEGPGRAGSASDPDAALERAIAAYPVVLGALLDDRQGASGPATPPQVLFTDPANRLRLWQSEGGVWPLARLAEHAAGIGIASLAGDSLGTVRDVPALVAVTGTVHPGLAVEAVRVAEGAAGYIMSRPTAARYVSGTIGIGSVSLRLPADGTLRFRATGEGDWAARTVSAGEVLGGRVRPGAFAGQIVLVGATAPELGALRPTAASPVTPDVQIHADAVSVILSNRAPLRPDGAWVAEAVVRALLAIAGLALGRRLAPGASLGAAAAGAGVWVAGCVALLHGSLWLIDPVSPPVVLIAATLVSATATAVAARRRAATVVARFRQHLVPEVVDRIVRQPGLTRIESERRDITFLFTDIEGFTAMSSALTPETVVALLNDYFMGITTIVTDAGGTVDKYVGDAVHAMFAEQADQAPHPQRAIGAAHRIHRFTEDFRQRPDSVACGLGRTRIGIETGEVVVGDVGGGARRDFTAHGTAINTAARLEALNAKLGTAICVGPVARAASPSLQFVSHGAHDLKGLGLVEVFEPLEG